TIASRPAHEAPGAPLAGTGQEDHAHARTFLLLLHDIIPRRPALIGAFAPARPRTTTTHPRNGRPLSAMISVLFCSRTKDNPASDVLALLDSAVVHVAPEDHDKIEFLIKFDDDDDRRPPDDAFAKYPFAVRTFCWSRGEGRHYLHHAQEYLFAQRDPR